MPHPKEGPAEFTIVYDSKEYVLNPQRLTAADPEKVTYESESRGPERALFSFMSISRLSPIRPGRPSSACSSLLPDPEAIPSYPA